MINEEGKKVPLTVEGVSQKSRLVPCLVPWHRLQGPQREAEVEEVPLQQQRNQSCINDKGKDEGW